MAKRVVIFTGSELRHRAFRMALALSPGIEVLRSYCEGTENTVTDRVEKADVSESALSRAHLAARTASEADFFGGVVALRDESNPVHLPRGAINDPGHAEDIVALEPDVLVSYGCSIVREPLLAAFPRRFLNIHLGLSPYYRGSGTNFWALVNREPEFVGVTFMHIDGGVDTGEIIHQMRARVLAHDTAHQIGNRLIADMIPVCARLLRTFDVLLPSVQPPSPSFERVCKRKDFTEEAVQRMYDAFADGVVDDYLATKDARAAAAPLVLNAAVSDA